VKLTVAQLPLDSLIVEFLSDSDWTPANQTNAISCLNRWTLWCRAHDLDLLAVKRSHCRTFLNERAAGTTGLPDGRVGHDVVGPIGPATLQGDWRYLRALYRWAAKPVTENGGGELETSPMEGVKAPDVPKRPATKTAKADVVQAVERSFPSTELGRRNAVMISLMHRSGLRIGELPWLDLEHYETRPDGRTVLLIPKTKNGEPRLVGVHPETVRYVERYLRKRGRQAGPLLRGDRSRTKDPDGRLNVGAIKLIVRRAAKAADVKLSPHQLRRAWTASHLRNGGDVLSLEILGGWADHRLPRRYLADEAAEAAVERYFVIVDAVEEPQRPRYKRGPESPAARARRALRRAGYGEEAVGS